MGRTLEALRKASSLRSAQGMNMVAAPHFRLKAEAAAPQGAEDEIPFIEIGGAGGAIEGSAAVLASPTSGSKKPAAGREARIDALPRCIPLPPASGAATAEHLTVAFQAVPPSPATLGPPRSRIAPEVTAYHQPDHLMSQQYRSLLSAMLAQAPLGGSQVLLLTAAVCGAGTTTVLANLAVTLARQSKKWVVVVDANLRRPALASRLGLANTPGLRDVLTGRFPLARALQETVQTNLMALTSGEPLPPNTPWPPASALQSTLFQLRKHVDLVMVDGPSWDGGPELATLTAACDAVYLVLRPGEIDTAPVMDLIRLIPHVGGHVGGYIVARRGSPAPGVETTRQSA